MPFPAQYGVATMSALLEVTNLHKDFVTRSGLVLLVKMAQENLPSLAC
ncbi:Uncharacterised protein [Vibrio cholerae]|nr:Uncharacterised protein [Vibrio cholerae]